MSLEGPTLRWQEVSPKTAASRGVAKAQQEGVHVELLDGGQGGGHDRPEGSSEVQSGQAHHKVFLEGN